MPHDWYNWRGSQLTLNIRVQPRASRDELAGVLGGQLKVRLTAPPVDGKANRALLRFLAKLCSVAPSQVTLVAGETGRNKRVCIDTPRRLPEGVEHPNL